MYGKAGKSSDGSVEQALLIRCARTVLGDGDAERIRHYVGQALDWDRLIGTAHRHRVALLLLRNLRAAGCDHAVSRYCPGLIDYARDIMVRNLFLIRELTRLLNLLEDNGIQALPYKGPITATLAYGHYSIREFQDLDILVRREDLEGVCATLEAEGFRTRRSLTPREKRHAERELKEYCYRSGPVLIEPHWSVTARRFFVDLDYDGMWRRARRVELLSSSVATLAPEDMLLIQSITGGKSKWRRLGLICDMAEMLRAFRDVDWLSVMARARKQGCLRMLLLSVALAVDILGAEAPDCVLRAIASDRFVRRLSRTVQDGLFLEPTGTSEFPWRFSPLLMHMRERPSDRYLYLWRTVTTPTLTHLRRIPLPDALFPLYRIIVPIYDYLLRPVGHWSLGLTGKARNLELH